MTDLLSLPELRALQTHRHLVRIPHECDVPLTDRVRQLLDSRSMRRLARISQLGLVALVYPGATHSRLEHALGVYRNALLYLKRLAVDERFTSLVTPHDAQALLVAALLHDVGHWPFCHAIEDLALPGVPRHEELAAELLGDSDLAESLHDDWNLTPEAVASLLMRRGGPPGQRLLQSLLSGPIDIDKMDYLVRDSLHAGVPYGRNFDQQRLIGALCLNAAGDGLAIRDKGRTAAEMMVFARYVMFSEVYWHHAVRSATAMLQRAFFLLHEHLELPPLLKLTEAEFIRQLVQAAAERSPPAAELLDGLFGPVRRLYKRLAEFSHFQQQHWYQALARQDYAHLVTASQHLAELLQQQVGRPIARDEILIDAPPPRREVEFHVEVYYPKEDAYRPLAEVSPAVHALATRQFDDFVKRVRIFVHPRLASQLAGVPLERLMEALMQQMAR
jgi:HD superfamily phosphohydrolase